MYDYIYTIIRICTSVYLATYIRECTTYNIRVDVVVDVI